MAQFTSRLAISADVPALRVLMDAAIAELQRAFLDDAQIASSRTIMGIDSHPALSSRSRQTLGDDRLRRGVDQVVEEGAIA